jgi:hypothetical protein
MPRPCHFHGMSDSRFLNIHPVPPRRHRLLLTATMALTDISIRTAKPKDKPYKMTDAEGMYLLINQSGKYWRLDYRYLGKRKTLALGVYPEVSLADARDKRHAARKLLAQDPPVDPGENRKSARAAKLGHAANSFEVIAREWVDFHMADKSPSHREKVARRFEVYLFPWIGSRPITEITAPELLEHIRRIQQLNKLETAHRTLQATGQVFRFAVQTGRATRDITSDLKGALPPTRTKHMASFTEPKDVAELLKAIEGFSGSLTVQCALKLAPLVFVRPLVPHYALLKKPAQKQHSN